MEHAAGKLISAIQKEWGHEFGEPAAEISEDIIDKGHDLLQAIKNDEIHPILDGLTVTEYLGASWDQNHPSVMKYITCVESALNATKNVQN